MLVSNVMKRDVVTVKPHATFLECAGKMITGGFRRLPVVDEEGVLVGIITIRDLVTVFYLKCSEVITKERYQETVRTEVLDFMTRKVVVTRPDALIESAVDLMLVMGIGCLPVVEDKRLVGIVTERDVVRVAAEMAPEIPVSDIMTGDVVTCDETCTIREIIKTMVRQRFRRLPVVDEEKNLLGIVTVREVLKVITEAKNWTDPTPLAAMQSKNLMLRDVYTVAPSATVREVARKISKDGAGAAVVVEDKRLVGIVTERDVLRSIPAVPWE